MEVKSYNLNDLRLYRSVEKTLPVKSKPYHIIENMFNDEELDLVKSLVPETALVYSKHIINNTDDLEMNYINSSKRDDTKMPVPQLSLALPRFKQIDNLVTNKILEHNDLYWNLQITGKIDTKYCVYREGHSAGWHIDGPFGINGFVPETTLWRKLSVSIALNDDYEGGELDLVVSSIRPENTVHSIKLGKGSAIVFPPYLTHRVRPITKGTRRALVYWFLGPRWK
jgi:hypothetical protein